MKDTIPLDQMRQHVHTGLARPLLPEGVPGPCRYRDAWWDAANGAQTYKMVTDPSVIAQRERQAAAYQDSLRVLAAARPER